MEEDGSEVQVKRYPKRIITSFQLGNLVGLMMSQMYAQQLPYFYLSKIGLDITLYLIAMIIYTLFNMFNDPLLGYFCDRSTRFTEKWGKRFPFIVMGSLPWCFMVILMFMVPSIEEIGHFGVFLWLLICYCLNDLVFSLYDINRVALFPDKFRDNRDRKWGGAITTILETLGVLLGILIPVLTIEYLGQDIGWRVQALIVAGVAFAFLLLMLPGVREDKLMRERRIRVDKQSSPQPFFKGLKAALKDKSLVGYVALYVCYSSTMGLVMASLPFFVQDILQLSKIGETIILLYVIGVLVAAPFWYKISYKIGIKKVALTGATLLACMGIPILFIPTGPEGLIFAIFIFTIAGLVDGAIITMTMPIFSSVVDNATIQSGKRQEGLYNGTFLFFSRIGIAIQATVFWIIRAFTGYHSGSTSASELMGLRIQMSVFPMVIIGTGIIIFWRLYRLSPEALESNVIKLKELKL
jgi:GPH family glycoside/pentoside/hexuronide:cation symporter